jgi:hypothetical protein
VQHHENAIKSYLSFAATEPHNLAVIVTGSVASDTLTTPQSFHFLGPTP